MKPQGLHCRFAIILILLGLTLMIQSCQRETRAVKTQDLVSLVDPFIGTDAHGHTFPGACCPFGMVQLSPDTRLDGWDGCSGYHYSDSIVYGFSHTHLSGTGVADYADFLFMAGRGAIRMQNGTGADPGEGYATRMDKSSEQASPGYYAVDLPDEQLKYEVTATPRTGWHRITGNQDSLFMIIDLAHRDKVLESRMVMTGKDEIVGYRRSASWAKDQMLYFCARFSQPIESWEWRDAGLGNAVESSGTDVALALRFKPANTPLVIKVGISAIDEDGARRNLLAESPEWDFDSTRSMAAKLWEEELSCIIVEGGTTEQQRTFYTALYHSFLAPNLYSDIDGRYRGRDGQIHWDDKHEQYTVFSLWDTYRAAHPLLTLFQTRRTQDFLNTMLMQYKQGGYLPVWELAANETHCMIGYHAVPVIADAILKGISNGNDEEYLEACLVSAMQEDHGIGIYRRQGFLAMEDEPESVSKTLEYAYDDWCIARLAEYLGQDSIARVFDMRAQSWKNIMDPETMFFRARKNGGWYAPFDPSEVNFNYTEANAWQYGFYVPQDVDGFIRLLGGPDKLEQRLDSLFKVSSQTTGRDQADITGMIGQYAHGNEPSHHIAYLYNFTGSPYKTQERVGEIMESLYSDKPDGLCGNEDCGQLSAWYVFSALGMYPLTPGSGYYVLGKPLFEKATMYFRNGHSFTVRKESEGETEKYVKKVSMHGRSWPYTYLPHDKLISGGGLVFHMDSEPSDWGAAEGERPVMGATGTLITPVPYQIGGARSFFDSTLVQLGCLEPAVEIFYSLSGDVDEERGKIYNGPLLISENVRLNAWAVRKDGNRSNRMEAEFSRIPPGRTISIKAPYSRMYTAGGDYALIDGVRGNSNFRTGIWQGYKEVDLDVTIDLGRIQRVDSIVAGFLQDAGSWIWLPSSVTFMVSGNGVSYRNVKSAASKVPLEAYGAILQDFSSGPVRQDVRYIRVIGKNIGFCPEWHPGYPYKGQAFVFADEIQVFTP